MTRAQACLKRSCDVLLSGLMLVLFAWLIAVLWVVAAIETRRNGFFTQRRIGLRGRPFIIYKIRTMRHLEWLQTDVTGSLDPRITRVGAWLRRTKLDELPQLVNVLIGDMSLVGPRPDTAEYAALIRGDDAAILTVRPGLTGPATLLFIDEQEILARLDDPERYNRDVIFPAKMTINRHYVNTYTFRRDLVYLAATLLPSLRGPIVAACGELLEREELRLKSKRLPIAR